MRKPTFKKNISVKRPSAAVGLDIEAASVAAAELSSGSVSRTAIAPLGPGVVEEGEVQDPDALAKKLQRVFNEYKLNKSVRVGIANQRVVVRTFQLPLIEDDKEIDTAVRFRAQDQIPMPLEQAVLDHRVIRRYDGDDGQRMMDVLAVAARRDMVASLLQSVRDAGLQPKGIDLSAFGMIRALKNGESPPVEEGNGMPPVTTLYCHLGDVTNLAVARGQECVFTRVAPFGTESIAERLASREQIPLDEAREMLMEVGLEEDIDLFSDDGSGPAAAREVLEEGASKLIDELRLSLDFYGAQDGVTAVDRVVMCGAGSTIPGLQDKVQAGLAMPITSEVPPALSHLDEEDAARLTVSYGLALGG